MFVRIILSYPHWVNRMLAKNLARSACARGTTGGAKDDPVRIERVQVSLRSKDTEI